MKNHLIQKWESLVESHLQSLFFFVESEMQICEKHIKSETKDYGNSFNFFSIISDLYYRENFHSDLMRFLLDPKENHECGIEFLRLFIDMLNSKGRTIDVNNYDDAVVVREEGRIDILIKSETAKRAIIIENKINNAADMQRQLPRYYDYISPIYVIDAIVYLPLDKSKHPDTCTWSELDKTNVNELLIEVPAYDRSGSINLVDNWLKPVVSKASNPDVISFVRQYSRLIQLLNKNNMDTVIMKEFYEELMKENNFQYALSIRNMLNDLPAYLESRIQEKYEKNCSPFSKVWPYKSEDAVFEGAIIGGIYLKMDIWCAISGYDVLFWTNDDRIEKERFFNLVKQIQSLYGFDRAMDCPNRVVKHFDIGKESELFSFIDSLKEDLQNIAEKVK